MAEGPQPSWQGPRGHLGGSAAPTARTATRIMSTIASRDRRPPSIDEVVVGGVQPVSLEQAPDVLGAARVHRPAQLAQRRLIGSRAVGDLLDRDPGHAVDDRADADVESRVQLDVHGVRTARQHEGAAAPEDDDVAAFGRLLDDDAGQGREAVVRRQVGPRGRVVLRLAGSGGTTGSGTPTASAAASRCQRLGQALVEVLRLGERDAGTGRDRRDELAVEELGAQPLASSRPTGRPAAPNWREIVTTAMASVR